MTFWESIVDKVRSRPTWSELLRVAWDFDSPWIKGTMTPYQSRPYARHIAVIPVAKLCDSIAIVFLSIEVRIRHNLRRYIDGSAILFWLWAQVEWWLEHRHGWLVKRQWARSWLGRVTRDEYQVLGSTSIPARLDTLVYWESFSWLTSVGTTRNTVNRLGWSRIGLAVLILNAAGAGLIGRPAVISGRYNKCHSLQLQSHYAHFPPLQHTRIHARHSYAELVVGNDHGFRGIVCWPWQEESCVIG